MTEVVKPWLWLSPSLAHKVSPTVIKGLGKFAPDWPSNWRTWRPFTWRGLQFPNRLGIAGGVDKDARNVMEWPSLGAGFVEIGTVTPLAQMGNTPPVLARDLSREALWNRLGFPSQGVDRVRARLLRLQRPYPAPVFANVGKNAVTPLDGAGSDYVVAMEKLRDLVDGFVINISSPNTRGLRELLRPDKLEPFLNHVLTSARKRSGDQQEQDSQQGRGPHPLGRPILLKLSPDLSDAELEGVLSISCRLGIDGWVLTNTTQGLRDQLSFPNEGGVSGRPLATLSKDFLRKSLSLLGSRRAGKLIISVGGVMSAEDVNERLTLGADLVQVYSALIFEGPLFFRKVAKWVREQQMA